MAKLRPNSLPKRCDQSHMNGMRDRAHLETIIDIESGVEIIFIITSEMNSLSCHSHINFKIITYYQISQQRVVEYV